MSRRRKSAKLDGRAELKRNAAREFVLTIHGKRNKPATSVEEVIGYAAALSTFQNRAVKFVINLWEKKDGKLYWLAQRKAKRS